MRRRQVIIVDAVLHHQLPVGGDVVFLHASDDLHLPGRRLVDHEVDVVLGAGEIVGERLHVLVEAHEPEAAILFESGRLLEPVRDLVKRFGIGVVAGHARERAVDVVAPAMIDAHEAPRIAHALGAHDRTAVAAGVEQAVIGAIAVAGEDDRPASDFTRDEVTRLLQFRCVADIDPAAPENVRHFLTQDVVGDQHLTVEQEGLSLAIVDDVGACGHFGRGSRLAAPRRLTHRVYTGPKPGQFGRARPVAVGSPDPPLHFSSVSLKHARPLSRRA